MVHNPGRQRGNNDCFCARHFWEGCAWDYIMCTFVANQHYNYRTIQVFAWLHIRKIEIGHFVLVYAWTEQLPWLDGFLVSLVGSNKSLLNVSLCTVSSSEKCWIAKKWHMNLTMFCRMWLKWSTTIKYVPLTHICSHSSVKRWLQSTHALSYTQKWGGFLKVDHWPEYENHSRDFF